MECAARCLASPYNDAIPPRVTYAARDFLSWLPSRPPVHAKIGGVHTSVLAALIILLLGIGAWGALRFTRWMAGQADRKVVLMAGVAAWTVLFGLLPFFLFAVTSGRVTAGIPPGAFERTIINLTPFTMLVSPMIGFIQGMVAAKND